MRVRTKRYMSFFEQLRREKVLSLSLLVFTLALGIVLGTLVTTGVNAASKSQAVAPDATPLTIPAISKLPNEFTKIAQMLAPSVVYISTDYIPKQTATKKKRAPTPQVPDQQQDEDEAIPEPFRRFFGPFGGMTPEAPRRREGSGSGFIVDKNGYIITNYHVVETADQIKVRLPGDKSDQTYKAKVIGFDLESDVAVIKIDPGKPLNAVKIGNSDSVQVGDWAVAIGAPFGLEATVTAGIVSATGRDLIGAQQFQHFIQTDAAINPGNSGGPLVNFNGEVVGINTMIASRSGGYEGIGFALPINMAAKVYNSIIQYGSMRRGSVGITFNKATSSDVLEALGAKNGVVITDVTKGGPADKAGIVKNDIILALNGKPVKDGDDLVARIADTPIGTDATVTLDRGGKKMEKTVNIADRYEVFKDDERFARLKPQMQDPDAKEEATTARFGIGIRPLAPEWKTQNDYQEKSGVQVTQVEEGSFAEEIGIREKDVIVSINRTPVNSIDDVRKVQSNLKTGSAVAFEVVRQLPGRRKNEWTWNSVYLGGRVPKAE
jgi:serine protease Do